MGILSYNDKSFLMDGKEYSIASGAMHYFRIPRAYWKDRLIKLKECGFNTVETYTCWNLHEPRECACVHPSTQIHGADRSGIRFYFVLYDSKRSVDRTASKV